MNTILVDKKVINLFQEKDIKLDIQENEDIIINIFSKDAKDININFESKNNSSIIINYSSIVFKNININIIGKITGSNNRCYANVRCISKSNNANINVSITALKDTENNEIIEDIKGINDGGMISVIPTLEIETNEVKASHFATIGSYNNDELFYLESKGININDAKEILKRKFLLSIFSEEYKKLIRKEENNE